MLFITVISSHPYQSNVRFINQHYYKELFKLFRSIPHSSTYVYKDLFINSTWGKNVIKFKSNTILL